MNTLTKIFIVVALLASLSGGARAAGFIVIQPKYKADTLAAPDPNYPPAAENRGHNGQGVYRLIINEKTGIVDQVQRFKSTGFADLDKEAIRALFNWKFKPGIKQRDVTIVFQGSGSRRFLH
jgi:TonB family protein